jgi:hypothetical protein
MQGRCARRRSQPVIDFSSIFADTRVSDRSYAPYLARLERGPLRSATIDFQRILRGFRVSPVIAVAAFRALLARPLARLKELRDQF